MNAASAVSPSQEQSLTSELLARIDGALCKGRSHALASARSAHFEGGRKRYGEDADEIDSVLDEVRIRAAGIQSPAAPVGALVCLACGGDATGGKCKNRRCIGGPIVEEVEAAPVGGEVRYDVLYEIAATFSLDYNEVCKVASSVLEAQPQPSDQGEQ